jgi:hypothetical protein
VQLRPGGTRRGSRPTPCTSPGADAVAIGASTLMAPGDEFPHLDDEVQDDLVAAAGEAPSLGPWSSGSCTALVTPA